MKQKILVRAGAPDKPSCPGAGRPADRAQPARRARSPSGAERLLGMGIEPLVADLIFFFQAEDGIRDFHVTGVQTCALPISTTSRCATPLAARARRSSS